LILIIFFGVHVFPRATATATGVLPVNIRHRRERA